MTEACKAVSDELNIPYKTVERDWGRRVRWIGSIIKMQDPTLLQVISHNFTQIRRSAWIEYAKGDNTAAKVGALRVIEQATKDEIEVLQSIGVITRLPLETTVTLASTPFDADPEMRKLLIESAAKQKRQKEESSGHPERESPLSDDGSGQR